MCGGSIPPPGDDDVDGPWPVTYAEVLSLAYTLCEAEGWMLGNAMRLAADDLGFALAEEVDDRPRNRHLPALATAK